MLTPMMVMKEKMFTMVMKEKMSMMMMVKMVIEDGDGEKDDDHDDHDDGEDSDRRWQ
jgi:hypothetical protein